MRTSAYAELAADYLKRASRFTPVEMKEVRPVKGSDAREVKAKEGERLLQVLQPGDHVVACDERGEELTTKELAGLIEQRTAAGGPGRLIFLIGGAEGLSEEVRKRADRIVALSKMTLPHELARVVLVEQIYRAHSMLRNHPYHREG